jgi:hypothetical protein
MRFWKSSRFEHFYKLDLSKKILGQGSGAGFICVQIYSPQDCRAGSGQLLGTERRVPIIYSSIICTFSDVMLLLHSDTRFWFIVITY